MSFSSISSNFVILPSLSKYGSGYLKNGDYSIHSTYTLKSQTSRRRGKV